MLSSPDRRSPLSRISRRPSAPSLHTVAQPAEAPGRTLVQRQAFLAQLLQGVLALPQATEPHPAKYVGSFGELNLGVLHDLPAVAPRIEEVEAPARQDLHVKVPERPPHRPPVVYHHTDVAMIVGLLRPPLREGDELVPRVYERHAGTAPTQLYLEEASEELQGLLDVANLQGDVVESHQCRAGCHVPILSSNPLARLLSPRRAFTAAGPTRPSPPGRLCRRSRATAASHVPPRPRPAARAAPRPQVLCRRRCPGRGAHPRIGPRACARRRR